MTSRVIIEACCGPENEVEVTITEVNADTEVFTLQDGETAERYVYDSRAVTVKEVEK